MSCPCRPFSSEHWSRQDGWKCWVTRGAMVKQHPRTGRASAVSAVMEMDYRTGGELGLLPLPLGEGWGEGLRSLDRLRTPSPQPSPQKGRGSAPSPRHLGYFDIIDET